MHFPEISMAEIIRNYQPGEYRHWFDAPTLSFFGTVLPGNGARTEWGNFFITQETNPSGESRFSIRVQSPRTGEISTVGKFHSHVTYADARDALREHLQELCAEVV